MLDENAQIAFPWNNFHVAIANKRLSHINIISIVISFEMCSWSNSFRQQKIDIRNIQDKFFALKYVTDT